MQTERGTDLVLQLIHYIAVITDELQLETLRAKIRQQIPELEIATMTIAEQMHQEGLAKGQAEASTRILVKQLMLEFGELDPTTLARIERGSPEFLEGCIERVLLASTLAAVLDEQTG